jgi:hypothetical protein
MPPAVAELRLRELLGSVERYELDLPAAIVVEDLHKRYRDGSEAVRGISFRVRVGEIFGMLGRTAPASRRRWGSSARWCGRRPGG